MHSTACGMEEVSTVVLSAIEITYMGFWLSVHVQLHGVVMQESHWIPNVFGPGEEFPGGPLAVCGHDDCWRIPYPTMCSSDLARFLDPSSLS